MKWWIALASLLACRADFNLGPLTGRGAQPLADAGSGTTLRIGNDLYLDGTASLDPDGTIVSYAWTIVSAPPSSAASLVDGNRANASITPDVIGTYEFKLGVTDNDGNFDEARVTFDVIDLPLTVNAGNDTSIEWRKTAQLTATVNVESGETPTLSWSFVSKPARSSTTLQGANTLTPSFVADADGTYVLQLTATTSAHQSSDTVSISAVAQRVPFSGSFIDAVFNGGDGKNTLIAISDSPPRVRFIDPVTGTETSITLPSTPIALSMDPYGNNVAVATAGKIHIIDIYARTLTSSFTISFSVSKIVYSLFGLVHCYTPASGPIQTLDLSNGSVSTSSFSVPAGSIGRQRLNDYVMYGIEAGTPRDIAEYASNLSPLSRNGDSPYNGEYQMGANLWLAYTSIVVSAGNVFAADPYHSGDMAYRGNLGSGTVQYAFGYNPKLITLHSISASDYQLRIYTDATLSLLESVPLPDVAVNSVPQPGIGRLIDYSPSYPNKFIIVESAGNENAFIVTYP